MGRRGRRNCRLRGGRTGGSGDGLRVEWWGVAWLLRVRCFGCMEISPVRCAIS
jgi:hypothetical protein